MSKKKMISKCYTTSLDWTCTMAIKKMKEQLEFLESKGYDRIDIDYDSNFLEIHAYKDVLETDRQFEERLKQEEKVRRMREKTDRALYKKLHKRFGHEEANRGDAGRDSGTDES